MSMSAPRSSGISIALTLANRYYDAFNARDNDSWLDTLDEDVEVLVDAGVLRGRGAALRYLNGILEAYPGVMVSDRRVVAVSGDAVVSEFRLTNPMANVAAASGVPAEPSNPWRLDGVTCEVLRLRGHRLISLHSYYSPSQTDRSPIAEVPSRAEAARLAHRQAALARVQKQVALGGSERDLVAVTNQVIADFAGVDVSLMMRFETDDTAQLLAVSATVDAPAALGRRLVLNDDIRAVRDSGRALRFGAGGWPLDGAVADADGGMELRWCVGVPILLHGEVWGASLLGSARDEPFAEDIEDSITAFTQMVSTTLSNARANDELRERAREKSELLRVAEIAAGGADPVEVFAAVVRSASAVLNGQLTTLMRFVDDQVADVLAFSGAGIAASGERLVIDPDSVAAQVMRTGRPARIDNYREAPGNHFAKEIANLHASAGVPISVDGQLWGMLAATSMDGPLPADVESRMSQFAGTVATAVAGAQARAELRALADKQVALRRVAEVIARGAREEQIYDAVCVEAAGIIDEAVTLIRFHQSRSYEVVGSGGDAAALPSHATVPAVGTHVDFAPDDDGLVSQILRTRRPARAERFTEPEDASGQAEPPDHYHLRGLTSGVGVPIIVGDRLWGVLSAHAAGRRVLTTAEQSLQQFGGLMAAAVANAEARGRLTEFAAEQVALRRIAELAAQDAPTEQVLHAVAVEASSLAGVEFGMVLQYERLGANRVVALNGAPDNFAVGMRAPGTGDSAVLRVWDTRRAARVDDLGKMSGLWPRLAHQRGFKASAGVPIVIHGRLWGALIVCGRGGPVPPPVEEHLSNFAELAATAISAAHARHELRLLADEQAAVRRVAELVARSAPLQQIFDAVAAETSSLLGNVATSVLRYEEEQQDVAVVMAGGGLTPVGSHLPVPHDPLGDLSAIERAVVLAGFAAGTEVGAVAVPVTVEGQVWGVLAVAAPSALLPPGSDERLTPFAELTAVAILNAENKSKLTASRARVIATADETRRRVQRDVHDGAQQRLVHTIIVLKMARDAAQAGVVPADLLDEALTNAERASRELRDIVRGILPAALTRGGLRSGLDSLLVDLALPVELRVSAPRLSPPIETTAYFIVAEAITNVVKHAHANRATVDITVRGTTLVIEVRDDGRGGADARDGTGLTGLLDRVEAANGTLTVTSRPGAGTVVRATLPLQERSADVRTS